MFWYVYLICAQGVAPFRGFVQERVALARRTLEKNGPDALKDWGPMYLYYGCRRSSQDFLYKDEWSEYAAELGSKFIMRTAYSRETPGQKVYVQNMMWNDRETLAELIADGKAYIYICGDAKGMCKDVEDGLIKMLGERKVRTKGGTGDIEKEGAAELKMLKDRSRMMLDVWS
jgi:NADPH-ferrihemoprotein reductase